MFKPVLSELSLLSIRRRRNIEISKFRNTDKKSAVSTRTTGGIDKKLTKKALFVTFRALFCYLLRIKRFFGIIH